jgi:hypothetical protein
MRKVHEKSILLGIGIGMIITAIAGMIYSAGTHKELTREEIISRAKGYGLIEPVKILNNDSAAADSTAAENTGATDTSVNDTSSKASPSKAASDKGNVSAGTAGETQRTDAAEPPDDNSKTGTDENKVSGRNIKITIEDGYTSKEIMKQLLDKGIITSEKDFTSVMISYNASRKIISGTYTFKKNEDLVYLVKTICDIK